MENNEIINQYIPMVDFIAEILGDNCEVVLHDLSRPEASIIAVKNGSLSGRECGGPLTDLVLKVVKNRSYKEQNYIANYKAVGNNKSFRSSSFFIKNPLGDIIGVLCVNIDVEPYIKVKELIERMCFTAPQVKHVDEQKEKLEADMTQEKLFSNIDDLLNSMVEEEIISTGISPQRMSLEEKIDLVKKFNDKGVFQLKGAVSQVAKALEVSEPTVYRYLNIIKE